LSKCIGGNRRSGRLRRSKEEKRINLTRRRGPTERGRAKGIKGRAEDQVVQAILRLLPQNPVLHQAHPDLEA
jgi:hypothetical protein